MVGPGDPTQPQPPSGDDPLQPPPAAAQGGGERPAQFGPQATQPAPQATPAGWYPDPQSPGAQRYWDGTQWTGDTSPAAGAAPNFQQQPQQPQYGGVPAGPTTDRDARRWAMFAHLSALIGLVTGLPFLGPLVIYLAKRGDHPFIEDQAREALNFNLSVMIYGLVTFAVTFVLIIVLVGILLIPVLIGLAIAWVVFAIIGAVRADKGEAYRYPLTIRLLT